MESLNVLNGKLSPKFDKFNDIYTVSIDSDVNSLNLDYEINEYEQVSIYGNMDFEEGENRVIIAVTNSEETNYITLIVNKKKSESVISELSDKTILEIENNNLPSYAPYLIGISCLSIILLIFCIFYIRKRKL